MKKYLLYFPLALAMLGASSCSQDRDPVVETPTEFHLNTPEMQNLQIVLSPTNTIEMTCSQPDYGYAAVAQYSAIMSLTSDFKNTYELTAVNPTSAVISIPGLQIAQGFCQLMGIEDEEKYYELYPDGVAPFTEIYFKAVCQLNGVSGSRIESNAVSFKYIRPYYQVPEPGFIYLVGSPNGWVEPNEAATDHYEEWKLMEDEDEIGSKIYSGVFNINAGDAMFRFYSQLTGWDTDSYGSQAGDDPVVYSFTNGEFEGDIVKGKGSYSFPDWAGGEMTIIVDMSDSDNMTINIYEGNVAVAKEKYIYLVGSLNSWTPPSTNNAEAFEKLKLVNSPEEKNIYSGAFDIDKNHADLYFRFALSLQGYGSEGWSAPQIGIQEENTDIDCYLTNNLFEGEWVYGKGAWHFDLTKVGTGTMYMTVDLSNNTVSYYFDIKEAAEE